MGGRYLEALYKNGLRGRYTWITDPDAYVCEVPDLSRIEIEHPYSGYYFRRQRITKMPPTYVHEVPDWNSISRKGELTLLITLPTCYTGMYLAPRLALFLNQGEYPFHAIAVQPFRFYPQLAKDAAAAAMAELRANTGKLTVLVADSVAHQPNMTLAEAYEKLNLRVYEETRFVINRKKSGGR